MDRPGGRGSNEASVPISEGSPVTLLLVLETYGDEGATVGYGTTGAEGAEIVWSLRRAGSAETAR